MATQVEVKTHIQQSVDEITAALERLKDTDSDLQEFRATLRKGLVVMKRVNGNVQDAELKQFIDDLEVVLTDSWPGNGTESIGSN